MFANDVPDDHKELVRKEIDSLGASVDSTQPRARLSIDHVKIIGALHYTVTKQFFYDSPTILEN